jgi:high potential iron-sulfur protein
MSDGKMGRRDAAKRALMVLGAAALAPSALAACGEEGGGGLTCTDLSSVPAAQRTAAETVRQSQQYTDHSPHADKHCNNCNQYTAGQANQCGTCRVVLGPVHPEGYCGLWAARPA